MKNFKIKLFLFVLWFTNIFPAQKRIIYWGILKDRDEKVIKNTYSKIASYLNKELPLYEVRIKILSMADFYDAIKRNSLHLVLVSSPHYHAIRNQSAMVSLLATEIYQYEEEAILAMGSTIFAKNYLELKDIRGKKVASMYPEDFFGYQLPMFHITKIGLKPNRDFTLIYKETYDEIFQAVLNGEADVGFLKTGILEEYRKRLPVNVYVINRQYLPHYPFLSSTILFPGSAVLALPPLDPSLARKISSLLLDLNINHPAVKNSLIAGFSPPADYYPQEKLAQQERYYPYTRVPVFTPADVWHRYRKFVIFFISLFSIILLLVLLLLHRNQKLQAQRLEIQKQKLKLDSLIVNTKVGTWEWKREENSFEINPTFAEILGYSLTEILPFRLDFWLNLIHPAEREEVKKNFDSLFSKKEIRIYQKARMRTKDNKWIWTLCQGISQIDQDGGQVISGILQNIEEQREKETQIELLSQIFAQSQEGIIITDNQGVILKTNAVFLEMLQFSWDIHGKNVWDIFPDLEKNISRAGNNDSQLKTFKSEIRVNLNNGPEKIFSVKVNSIFLEPDAQFYLYLLADITQEVQYREKIEKMALYDELTSLPNRHFFSKKLREAISEVKDSHTYLGIIYIDLDGFKLINDSLGHDFGDQVLQEIGRRLHSVLRAGDIIARVGGDEFVGLLKNLESKDTCNIILPRILAQIGKPIPILGIPVSLSASIGVTFYPQNEELDAEQLIRQADQAMYQAKLTGKNRYCFFDPEHDKHLRGIHQGMATLRSALEKEQFLLYLQPKVNMRTGVIIGLEALLRWQHPDSGIVPPAAFLGIIENHSLAIELGEWVIEKAFSLLERRVGYPISVNISTYHLQQANFLERLEYFIQKYSDVPPNMLELEILETGAMKDPTEMANLLKACHKLGVQFSLDDFGTGYSSLAYLRQLPVHTLKIDRSFVRDILDDSEDLAILEGVLDMAGAFQRKVIAEGVETLEHGKMLLRLGCELGQGFAIAKPMPVEDLENFISSWSVPKVWQKQPVLVRSLYPFLNAMVILRTFYRKLERYVEGKIDTAPDCENPESEPLYVWIEQQGKKEFADRSYWPSFLRLIEEIYRLAREVVLYRQNGEILIAQQKLNGVNERVNSLIGQLDIFILSLSGTIYDEKSLPLSRRSRVNIV